MSRAVKNVGLARLRALQNDAAIQLQPKPLAHYFGGARTSGGKTERRSMTTDATINERC